MQLIILGMHRSGTSVLARLLNMMGAYFGPEGISTGANKENPKGFWERRDVRQINDFVLNSVGCDWNKIADFDVDALPETVITEFREKASKIVLELDSHRPWFIKEPRLCLLFNLWNELLEVPVCIHIYRNPVEVANSLYTRNGIPVHTGIALWEKYNLSALEASHGLSRFVVSHNNLMKDPVSEVKYIYEQLLSFGMDGLHLPSKKEIIAFVRKDLYREKVGDEEFPQFLNANQTKIFNGFTSGQLLKRRHKFKLSKASVLTLEQYEQLAQQEKDLIQQRDQQAQEAERALASAAQVEADLKKQLAQQEKDLIQQRDQQEKDLTQQRNQQAREAKRALASAAKVEARLKKQLAQQDKDLIQQRNQQAREAERALASAAQVKADLKKQLAQQEKDLTQQRNQQAREAKRALASAAKVEADLKKQLAQQDKDLTQQREQQAQEAERALASAAQVEADLKKQLAQQEKDLTQQRNQQAREAKRALASAAKVEADLKKQLAQQDKDLTQQREQQAQEAERALASAAQVEADLKKQLAQQEKDLIQQRDQQAKEAERALASAAQVEADLKKQLAQQDKDLTQQREQQAQEAERALASAAQVEADLKKQLAQQEKDLIQQRDQQAKEAERALASAAQVEADLRQQLAQQDKDLTQQREQQAQEAERALASAAQVEADLKKQLEQQNMQLRLFKKGVIGIEQFISRQDEIINQLFNGIDSLVTSRRWLFGNAVFSLRYDLLFKKSPPMATDYLKKVRGRYHAFKSTKQPLHIHVLDVLDEALLISSELKNSSTMELNDGSKQEKMEYSEPHRLSVIVCVHNALDDVKNCLTSIIRNTSQDYTLHLIDDGSDQVTKNYLYNFSRENLHTILVRNEEAMGYTKSANIGLRASSGKYVILLNSDTIVTPLWDEKIIECGESNPKIGIIGPLSNAASWQSTPERYSDDGDWMVNKIPDGMNIDDMGDLVSKLSKKEYPLVPLINGFCFAIKRSVIERVGYLDEDAFPKGYGEENDYCFRTGKEGFLLAIADNTYVYHAKSKSFSHEGRRILAKQGAEKLKELYGKKSIADAVGVIRDSIPLRNIRQAIRFSFSFNETHAPMEFMTADMKVLFLLPVSGGGGGVHSIVQETLGMRNLGVYARIAVPNKYRSKFQSSYPSHWYQVFYFFESEEDVINYAAQFDAVIATIFTSVKLLEKINKLAPKIIPAYYIQDYEPWFSKEGTELHKEALISYTRIPGIKCFAKTDWIRNIVKEKHGVDVAKVKPSIDKIIYYPSANSSSDAEALSICAMIRPKTPRRSPALTMKVLRHVKRGNEAAIKVDIFGCDDSDKFFQDNKWNFGYTNHGHITREEVSDILRSCDLFIDLSEYQAFGRTGLEAMACGCIPVLPSIGGVYEYAINDINSIIIETNSESEMDIVKKIRELLSDAKKMKSLKNEALLTSEKYSIESAAQSEIELLYSVREVG